MIDLLERTVIVDRWPDGTLRYYYPIWRDKTGAEHFCYTTAEGVRRLAAGLKKEGGYITEVHEADHV